jgi:5-methylthioadenosine/S-adenosylhomocysteine deaminase
MIRTTILACTSFLLLACSAAERDAAPPSDAIDLIVAGDYVVTMDAGLTVIEGGAVAVDDGVIIAVGPAAEIHSQHTARETLSGDGRVVMPGLVNGHTHAAMSLLRGLADDLALMDWLTNYMFPAEVQFVDAEFVRIGTELSCWEMIRGGTTTFVDMYYYPDTIAQVIADCGMRALISSTVIDQRSPDAESAGDSIAKGTGFIDRWKDRHPGAVAADERSCPGTRCRDQHPYIRVAVRITVFAGHLRQDKYRNAGWNRFFRRADDCCARRVADGCRDTDSQGQESRSHS